MDNEGIYFSPEFDYSTLNITAKSEDWLPVTYSPNNCLIGSGAVTPSTSSSSHSAPQPLNIAKFENLHDGFPKSLDNPVGMDRNLLGVPSPRNYPIMGLESPWAPMRLPRRDTYPTPPEQEPLYIGGFDGSSFCSDIEMTREWQSPNDARGAPPEASLATWDNRRTSVDPRSGVEVDTRCRSASASRSASPTYQSPTTLNFTRASSSSKLRTAQMQRRSSTHTAGPPSKTTHNEVEKNYRNRLNGHFKQLLSKIPADLLDANGLEGAVGQKNVTKADTLALAVQYIKVLREQERELSGANKRLENEYERLKGEWAGIGGVMIP